MSNVQAFLLIIGFVHSWKTSTSFLSGFQAAASKGVRCFSCDEAETPGQCTESVQCGEYELCYLEKYVRRSDLSVAYRGGCRLKSICNIKSCLVNNAPPGRKRADSIGTLCAECCTSEHCNLKLCQFDQIQALNQSVRCYQCDHTTSPDGCSVSRFCADDEECRTGIYFSNADGRYFYRSDCMRRAECEILGSISDNVSVSPVGRRSDHNSITEVQLKSRCCNTTLCNDFDPIHGPNNASSIKYVSKDFECPTTPPPSTMTPLSTTPTTSRPTTPTSQTVTTPKTTTTKPTTTTQNITTPTTIMPTFASTIESTGSSSPSTTTVTTTEPSTTTSPTTSTTTTPTTTTTPNTTTTQTTTSTSSTIATTTTTPTTRTTTTTTKTTTPTTTTSTPTTTTTTLTTTSTPTTTLLPTSCYVCNGPSFACESHIKVQHCNSVDQQFCLNKLVNNDDGTRNVYRSCGNENQCRQQWLYETADKIECADFDPQQLHRSHIECTYCCTGPNCNAKLVPDRSNLYLGN